MSKPRGSILGISAPDRRDGRPSEAFLDPRSAPGPRSVVAASRALLFIAAGVALQIFDVTWSLTTNGAGWRFDALSDTLGMFLIFGAVVGLSKLKVDGRYKGLMRFVLAATVIELVSAVASHVVIPVPEETHWLALLLAVARLLLITSAMVAFGLALDRLYASSDLPKARASWRVVMIVGALIWIAPNLLVLVTSLVVSATGSDFTLDFGIPGFVVLVVPALFMVWCALGTRRLAGDELS